MSEDNQRFFWIWKKKGKNQREKLHPTPFETKREVEKDLYFNSGILTKDLDYIRQVEGCWVGGNSIEEENDE